VSMGDAEWRVIFMRVAEFTRFRWIFDE
jgi:hypothetical protein